jgi:hypothetical protein
MIVRGKAMAGGASDDAMDRLLNVICIHFYGQGLSVAELHALVHLVTAEADLVAL